MCSIAQQLGLSGPDYVLISHFDKDHFYGLNAVLEKMRPSEKVVTPVAADELWGAAHLGTCQHWNRKSAEDDFLRRVLNLFAKEQGLCHSRKCAEKQTNELDMVTTADRIRNIQLGPGVSIKPIKRSPITTIERTRKDNDTSLAWVCTAGTIKYYTAGDLEAGETGLPLEKFDIVKCGHHGSWKATSKGFLDVAKPTVAILQGSHCGFHHPHRLVLKRLIDAKANIYSTNLGEVTKFDAARTVAGSARHAGDILTMVWDDNAISVFWIDKHGAFAHASYLDGEPINLPPAQIEAVQVCLELNNLTSLTADHTDELKEKKASEAAHNIARAQAPAPELAAQATSLKRKPPPEKQHLCEEDDCSDTVSENCETCHAGLCADHFAEHVCEVQTKKTKR
jgi:beta-lactamase superfamily II metal-dependent hydrolase